jgi:hypothetical protein
MALDVLLIEEEMLDPNHYYRQREQQHFYELANEAVVEALRKVVDLKILTKKTLVACKKYHINNVYNVNKYLMS